MLLVWLSKYLGNNVADLAEAGGRPNAGTFIGVILALLALEISAVIIAAAVLTAKL